MANNSPTYLAALRFYAAIFPHLKRLRFGGIYADIFASQFIELICVRYGEKKGRVKISSLMPNFFACDPTLQIRFGNRFDLYIKFFVQLQFYKFSKKVFQLRFLLIQCCLRTTHKQKVVHIELHEGLLHMRLLNFNKGNFLRQLAASFYLCCDPFKYLICAVTFKQGL